MQTKYEKYEQLSHDILHKISESKDNWLSFLDTASRMYKYSFDDQVLIHAQRPDTRACADFAFWTAENRMNLHVKRHSDGIALLDRDRRKLHYVYAVEDTEPRENGKSRNPEAYIWQLSQENRAVINTMLCDQGSIQSENIEKTIVSMAYSMARLKTADYANELDKMYDSLSPSIPREEFRTAFATFVAESSAYMAARRTGTDVSEYLSKNQFANLYLFQNTYITGLVGEATADTAQAVLRQIERNVNEYKRLERSVGNGEYQREQRTQEESSERNTLRSGRGNSDLSSVRGRERRGRTDSDRTVREDEREISQGELQGNLQHNAASEHTDTSLTGDRRTGVGEVRPDSEGVGGSGRNERGTEGNRPAEMGGSNEQLQGFSSGNSYQRDNRDRNREYNISEEAEVINTSAFSVDEAIHSAFAEVSLNHSFSEKQQKFLDRIEKFAVRNNVTENIVNAAFERATAFHSHYISREFVSKNIFARRLGSIEKELEEAIKKNTAIVATENNAVSNESHKYGTQSLVRTEINGEIAYYKFSGMYLADIMSVAADSGALQGYEEIGTPIGETEFAEIEQSADFTFSVDLNSDDDSISIYTVNNGIGGIPEGERTDDNISIENYKLSEYLHPITDDIVDTNDDMEQLSLFSDIAEEIESTVQQEAEPTVKVETSAVKKPVGDKKDFVITNENLGEGGAKTKYRANVAAIRTLKEIEAENRLATAEEQQILSQYVGWGGLKNAFEDFHDDWKNEYAELKELLTTEEYSAAAASVLNAHYTSPVVISAMYDALKNNGFTGGRVLEPALGVGNFFGVMPTDLRENSKLYGVELDSISGRIAQQLYQGANIKITGFEKTDIKNDTFDLAVGNVPFGGYSLNEAAYNKYHFQIHDHFFAKSLDKVKPNGIVAFITSKGTMDKSNPAIRKYIAERAELVGAIRLPNNAFKGNAGTEVTSDIIFLQKREKPIELTQDNMPSWIDLGKTEDGLTVNQYFIDNPEMVLGKIVEGNKLYGHGSDDTMCVPIEWAVLKDQLAAAIKNIKFKATVAAAETSDDIFNDDEVVIPQNIKNFSYAIVADKLYYRNNNDFELFEGKKSDIPRIKGMVEIRDSLRDVISCQIDNGSDMQLQALQQKLNSVYDSYVEKYGRLNTKQNLAAFKEDSAAPLLSSLEQYKGEEFIGKAAIFDKRTILAKTAVTSVETSAEALTLSLAKKAHVDMAYMQQLTGFTTEKIMEDLKGVVFENPMKMDDNGNPRLEASDEYLSGNIRKKLEYMQEHYADDSRYTHNIEALENAMPIPLQAADIDIKLGAPCISKEFIQQFMYENFGTPNYLQQKSYNERSCIKVNYSELTSRWSIQNKSADKSNTAANAKFGTKRKSAYEILEDCLNLQSTTVRDRVERDGKEVSVINHTETEFAQEKQRQLQEAFKQWIYAEPKRREAVVDKYNRMFNSIRPREYDGSALEFPGMNNEIQLRKHQKDAVARALFGGNTGYFHEVGAGKTYEMIAAAMEGKRLGLHNKALICVPNHLTEQEGADFIKLYPNANILVATADDFSKKNRRKLFAKIATGDYDAVIIGHSQLINLPISKERQERLLQNQIDDIINGIQTLKDQQGDNWQIKQMERTRKSLEAKLEKLTQAPVRDDVVNFEELGIDKLIIDEAHMFKNLFISTKMSNISGISTNDNVQKTMDLYLKTQYLDEITGSKGVIFATGTPVSNSISEIYTMMRYLQNDLLEETGLKHFDMWAANFAEIVTESQLSPEGNSYQQKTRFARFNNLPELMALFKECADIKTTDQLGLKIPECEMHTVVAQPSEIQKKLISDLGERAKRIRSREVDPSVDNMLMIVNDGKKIGLDVRLLNPDLPDDENSKLNICINNVCDIWNRTSEQRSTQVIFCDLGVPQSKADVKKKGKRFSVYDDIKEKLIQKGVPAEEIAFIHSAKTEEAKDKLFAKVRKGEIRVLIGSTDKMGAGTNIQNKLVASHDLDAPSRPSDMEQRRGRMVRQGNENDKVDLYRYVSEGTFDAYLYQMLENKQKFTSQIMTSKSPVRSCQDLDEVTLSYAEIKALSAGNPLIKEKMDLDIEVSKLKMLKASHMNALYDLQDKVNKELPTRIKTYTELKARIEADIQEYKARPVELDDKGKPVFPSIELFGKVYTDKEEAGKALIEACKKAVKLNFSGYTEVGSYQGFKLNIGFEPMNRIYVAQLKGSSDYRVELGGSESGNFTRLDNALNGMEDKLTAAKQQLERLQNQLEEAMAQLDTPFPHEQELQEKSQRLDELTKQLESAADDKPTSELAEIVDPYFIEVSSEEAADKLKNSGITFEMKENEDHFIVKINRSDKDKVHDLLEQQKKMCYNSTFRRI